MSSRIAQLALVDFLFVRVAQRRHAELADPLRRTLEVTATHMVSGRKRREQC